MGYPQPQGVPATPMHLQQMQMQMQMIEQQQFQMQEFTRIMDEMQARATESERRYREMRDADDRRHQAEMQRMKTEIERAAAAIPRGGTTSSTNATGSNTNRRHSIFIANSEFDAAAIDKALHQFKCDSTFSGLKSEDVAAVADVAPYDETVADKSNPRYEAYVAQRVKDGHIKPGEVGPRPAYEHPRWYRRDGGACRYCKATTHNTALCKKLYNKVNGSEMPSDLISANTKILAATD